MKKFAKNSLTVNMAFDFEEVGLRCCLIMVISSTILTIKMKILGVYVLFDFKKTFDSVSHNRLLFKLEKIGFDKKSVHLISSYPSDWKQHVSISNVLSLPCSVPSGVPHGSILGPIYFQNS